MTVQEPNLPQTEGIKPPPSPVISPIGILIEEQGIDFGEYLINQNNIANYYKTLINTVQESSRLINSMVDISQKSLQLEAKEHEKKTKFELQTFLEVERKRREEEERVRRLETERRMRDAEERRLATEERRADTEARRLVLDETKYERRIYETYSAGVKEYVTQLRAEEAAELERQEAEKEAALKREEDEAERLQELAKESSERILDSVERLFTRDQFRELLEGLGRGSFGDPSHSLPWSLGYD
jgi:hypothetical protein